mgnify:FL=1
MNQIRWAIVGTGNIARQFAEGMREAPDAVLSAVVSRSEASGRAFAAQFGCDQVYTDYTQLLERGQVDVVYLGLPNHRHFPYILEALEHRVAVLSEKPMVDNRRQLDQVLEKAREKQVFLMEGMWTRCFPAVQTAKAWLEQGKIGRPLSLPASFSFLLEEENAWRFESAAAGGALRDVGIYPLGMAYLVFPEGPQQVHATVRTNGQVDMSCHMMLQYSDGRAAFLSGAFDQLSGGGAENVGGRGRIVIGPEFWRPTTVTRYGNDGAQEQFTLPYPATGFQYEIAQVNQCLREGLLECPLFPHRETEQISDLIEDIRLRCGIRYPTDEA